MYKNYSSVRSMGHIHPPACTVHSLDFYFVYRKRNSAPHKVWGISGTWEHVGDWCWPCWWQKGEGGTENKVWIHLYWFWPDLIDILITCMASSLLRRRRDPPPCPNYLINKLCAMWKLSDRDLSNKKIIFLKYCYSLLGIFLLFPPLQLQNWNQ